MNNLDKHYLTLGLQHGATQEEIHAAFQRMSVKYHPDNDSSLDAQMKFHEARQAYAALSKPAEPTFIPPEPPNATRSQTSEPPSNSRSREQASGFSNSTSGARQHATHNQNFTGFTNSATGAKNNSNNRKDFHEAIKDHPDLKEAFKNYYAEKEPQDSKLFSDFPIHDYFHRWQVVVLTVIGSIIVLFIAQNYITMLSLARESSVRLFLHISAFLLISWPIFWYIRFTEPKRGLALLVVFSLGAVYACWIYYITLPEEIAHMFRHGRIGARYRSPFDVLLLNGLRFCIIFYLATHSLEKEGIVDAFTRFIKAYINSRSD